MAGAMGSAQRCSVLTARPRWAFRPRRICQAGCSRAPFNLQYKKFYKRNLTCEAKEEDASTSEEAPVTSPTTVQVLTLRASFFEVRWTSRISRKKDGMVSVSIELLVVDDL
jgi:hypothetical protein